MCITKEEKQSIQETLIILKNNQKTLLNFKKQLIGIVVGNILLLLSVGVWVGTIQTTVKHNGETLFTRTENRFYKQDGEVLMQKITHNEDKINALTSSYRDDIQKINEKLDKLIEKTGKL